MMVSETGRAMVADEVGVPLRLEHRAINETLGAGDVLVRIQACGVCGSDLFLLAGGFGADRLPVVPGHEASGTVEAMGDEVTGFERGDQVALYYIENDPQSSYVLDGRPNIGPSVRRMGVDVDGAFADFIVRPAETLIKPRQPVDPVSLAVLTDAVATPYHALTRVAAVQPGERVLILGVGGIGSNAVQLAKHLGAEVTAVSRSAEKLDLACDLGADHLVRARSGSDAVRAAVARVNGDGPDVVLQCVGSSEQDELAIALARPGGRVVLVGASTDPFSVRSVDLIWKELAVFGSRGFVPEDIDRVIELHLNGLVRTDHLIGASRPLEEADAALDDLRAGRVLRSVLVM